MSNTEEHGRAPKTLKKINKSVFFRVLCVFSVTLFFPGSAAARNKFEMGGLFETAAVLYPSAPNPADAHVIGSSHFQIWSRTAIARNFSWRARMDFRLDTHRDVDRARWFDVSQRGLRQPAGAVSEFYLDMKLGRLDLRAGTQEIRWGRADGFHPTDNLIPYDYLDTFSSQRIALPAVKADGYAGKAHFEGVWIPFYTPTRLPLLGQRWFPQLPETAAVSITPGTPPIEVNLSYTDAAGPLPARTFGNGQWGVRWNQLVPRAEFSVSYFDGFDDLPYFRSRLAGIDADPVAPKALVSLSREYYRIHVIGADFASALGPVGLRGETAYFDQTDPANRDHLLFVVGIDRSWGEWFAVIQYADLNVAGTFDSTAVFPDLGLRSTLMWRIERTIGPARSIEIKGALRLRDGDFLIQPVYNLTVSNRWQLKLGAAVFGGPRSGYLGQFRDNGSVNVLLRYMF
jgi:hypothetical protein